MRVYKNIEFKKFARKNDIADKDLLAYVAEIENGLVDAALGAGVLKKRISGRGKGKRGGFRTLVFFREGKRMIFVHGFSKGQKANIAPGELDDLKALARILLNLGDADFALLVKKGDYTEVKS